MKINKEKLLEAFEELKDDTMSSEWNGAIKGCEILVEMCCKEHPTCNQCDSFYLGDQGYPSKVAMCRVLGICVNPMGYCHVHSELLEG